MVALGVSVKLTHRSRRTAPWKESWGGLKLTLTLSLDTDVWPLANLMSRWRGAEERPGSDRCSVRHSRPGYDGLVAWRLLGTCRLQGAPDRHRGPRPGREQSTGELECTANCFQREPAGLDIYEPGKNELMSFLCNSFSSKSKKVIFSINRRKGVLPVGWMWLVSGP